jgi:hypothetical protein
MRPTKRFQPVTRIASGSQTPYPRSMNKTTLRRFLVIGSLTILLGSSEAFAAYSRPIAKQGVTDLDYTPSGVSVEQRYAALTKLGIGLKIYNYFWAAIENVGIASTASPMRCPGGTTLVPSSTQVQSSKGYHRFHCYNTQAIANFDAMLAQDMKHKIQSIAVMFNTPAIYRTRGCVASAEGIDVGCVPDDNHLDDYEDYVNFLADHYDGKNPKAGKISHFIVWNEVGSGTWFNMSPSIDVNHSITDPALVKKWVNKYVDMFTRSAKAVRRHSPDSLIEVSLDVNFVANQPNDGGQHAPNIGGKTILDGMWEQIGTRRGWAVAVHPYFDPEVNYGPNILNFAGLPTLADYQRQQLIAHGTHNPDDAQQALMLASEQGWFNIPLSQRAGNICKAHRIAMATPNLIGTTHNFFQGRSPADDGEALIPFSAGELLQGAGNLPTYQAYLSTGPKVWGQTSNHYCCQQYRLGCDSRPGAPPVVRPTPNVIGQVDNILSENGHQVLRGWACNVGDPDPIGVQLFIKGPAGSGQFITGGTADHPSEPDIATACDAKGTAYRFEFDLSALQRTNPNASLYVHGISSSGGSNNLLSGSGSLHVP